jgi:hypothetical protein
MQVTESRTVTSQGLRRSLKRCIKAKRPAMIWGPPGVGKSDIVAGLCREMGGRLYDMRLSTVEQTDLRGMPYYNKDTGKMEWAPPIDLPDLETASKYPIVFLFMDELNSAAPATQAAAYQLILNRKVGTYTLPDNVVVFAAGNRDGDRGVTYRMPTPLANRFVHLELRVDFDSWHEWALENKIHSDVVGFLNFSKNSLYDFDPKSNSKAFATPRSWEFVSQLISEDDQDETTTTDLVSGTVGEGLALKFFAHRKVSSKLPLPMEIFTKKVTELKTKEISAMYSLATSCAYELDDSWKNQYSKDKKNESKWHEMVDNCVKFMMDNFSVEITVMSVRAMLQQYNLPLNPAKMTNFGEFYSKYGKLILKSSQQ